MVNPKDLESKIRGKVDLYEILVLLVSDNLRVDGYYLPKINYVPVWFIKDFIAGRKIVSQTLSHKGSQRNLSDSS